MLTKKTELELLNYVIELIEKGDYDQALDILKSKNDSLHDLPNFMDYYNREQLKGYHLKGNPWDTSEIKLNHNSDKYFRVKKIDGDTAYISKVDYNLYYSVMNFRSELEVAKEYEISINPNKNFSFVAFRPEGAVKILQKYLIVDDKKVLGQKYESVEKLLNALIDKKYISMWKSSVK